MLPLSKVTILLFSLFLCAQTTFAGNDLYHTALRGSAIALNSSVDAKDVWYDYMQSNSDWYNYAGGALDYNQRFVNFRSTGRVRFQYDGTEHLLYTTPWEVILTYRVRAYAADGSLLEDRSDQLTLTYDPAYNATHVDIAVNEYPGAHRLIVDLTHLCGQPNGQLSLANDFILEGSIEVDRFYTLNYDVPLLSNHRLLDNDASGANTTIQFYWSFTEGAEQYELQYLHVSDVLINGQDPVDQLDFAEATRIQTSSQEFRLIPAYETGSIFYRVRPLGRHGNNFKFVQVGEWSAVQELVLDEALLSGVDLLSYETGHNWSHRMNHQGEGKYEATASFFDGLGRSRQTVRYDQENQLAHVQESMVDYEGRPAVAVIPTPVVPATMSASNLDEESYLKFYNDYTLAHGTNLPFSEIHFDLDSNRDAPLGLDATQAEKAGSYFSTANPLKDYAHHRYLADGATGGNGAFTYTRTLYDHFGRVKERTGVGEDYHLGSGHTTKYYYGTPSQQKLDRLFGTEVGYAEHYRKRMTQDPNGQLTVSYEKLDGQVIATALVGYVPTVNVEGTDIPLLDEVSTADGIIGNLTEELGTHNRYLEGETAWELLYTKLVSTPGPYQFDYDLDLTGAQYATNCGGNSFSADCQYELDIELIDPDGQALAFAGTFTATVLDVNGNPTLSVDQNSFPVVVTYGTDYDLSFSANFGEVGNYTIRKTLRLINAESALAAYTTFVSDPASGCATSGSIVSECDEIIVAVEENYVPGNGEDCSSLLDIFKADLSPGGQYFDNLINGVDDPTAINDWLRGINYAGPNVLAPDNSLVNTADFLELEAVVEAVNEENIWFSTVADGWAGFREYWYLPEVQEHLHGTGPADWGLYRYHPEYGHYEWCLDLQNSVAPGGQTSAAFDQSLLTYNSGFDTWISELASTNCPSPAVNYALVNADPYFASSLGSRPVNGDGLNGQELMRDLLCTYPEQSLQSLPTNTMWAAAVEAANQQNGGSSTTAERWEVFASYYVQQKRRVINLQKKNPCDSERYSPFLFDAATPTDPADMVADLPRDHAFNYWGNATYDLGSGTTPTSGLHPVYADWDASCGVQTSSIARVSALLDEWSYGDNEQLRVMDERAAGFAIRIPDMEQVAQDLVDDGANDGILGENDDWDELGQMINTTNPCVAGASVLIDYPTPFVAYPTTAANILLQIQRTIRYWDQTSTPADCIVINSDPSSCSNGVDGTAIYYSMEDFYWANPDFFDCMVATVNDYVSVPYDFVATHTPTHFVITSPSHGDLIPNGAIFSTYNDCTTCVGNLRNRSAGGKEMEGPRRPFDGRSDWRTPSGEETKARTRAGASPLGACYEFWNPCDQIIPHCLCEDLNGAAGLTAGGTAVEIAALYALEYGSTAAAWEPFVEELMSQCNTIIYNAFASDAAQVDAVALIEDLADGVVDLPSSPNHPAPIVLDCFTNEPPPCDEAQTIADYYNEAIGEDAIGALLEEFPFAYANTCLNSQTPPDDLSMSYVDREYHFTLYYYSAEGNLYATVPPEGVRPISGTDPTVFDQIAAIRDNGWGSVYEVPVHRRNPERDDQFMTVNHYDSYDNFTETRHPDHQGFTLANDGYRESGATEYLYDDIGQLRFFRDPQQASEGKVTYAKYDAQGREIETGEFYWPTGFNFLEQQVNDPTFPLASEHALEEITQTYYDEVSGASPGSQTNLRNRIAKQQYYEAESVLEHATYYSYDIFGNVRSLWQEDFNVISTDGFRKRLDYEYDQAFRLLEEVHYQSGQSDAYHHRYCYDANNRLTRVLTNSAGGIWEEDRRAFYRFDDLIARAELGDYKVQGSDFSYTLPGWLKGVNSATLQSERDPGNDGATSTSDPYNQLHRWMARDACGTSLYYHADDYQSIKDFSQVNHFYTDLPSQNGLSYDAFEGSPIVGLYDGNITAQQTALTGENGTLMDYVVKGYRYDQAMRLTTAKTAMEAASNSGSNTVLSANYWDEDSGSTDDYLVSLTYDRNGNINTLLRNGTTQSAPLAMDNLAYFYSNNSSGQINNRLNSITDLVPSASYDQDLDSQPSNNYTYDRIGNLTQDLSEEIASIEWTLHRRVKAVKRTAGSTRPDIEYRYDSRGNRIEKIVKPKSSTGDLLNPTHWEATHYVRGIDGKEIATYRKRYGIPRVDGLTVGSLPSVTKFQEEVYVIASGSGAPVPEDPSAVPELSFSEGGGNYFGEVIQLQETYVRAASRIGTDYHQQTVGVSLFSASIDAQTQAFVNFNYWEEYDLVELAQVRERTLGEKVYELTNHLQSVVEVVSDRLIAVSLDGLSVEHYVADIQSATDYYPFGMAMPNRSYQADPPRYGYTGQENEPEWGDQSMQNYELRMYSAAAGRFLSIDPAAATYVSLSSYAYVANNPIVYVDPTGAYIEPSDLKDWKTQTGYVKNRKAKLEKKIKDLEATAKEKNWSDKKLNRKIGNRRERIRRLEATIQTFKDMEADTKQRYNISFVTGGMGKVYYDSSTDDVVIDYTSTANFVHEITHIGQYRAGDIAFMRNSKKSYAVDLYDEVEAYKAQFAFDGVSVGALNASATSFKRITPEFVKVLKNKAGLRIYAGHGIIPIDINATKADLIKAFPNAKKLDELHESFVLKTVSNIIYFKK